MVSESKVGERKSYGTLPNCFTRLSGFFLVAGSKLALFCKVAEFFSFLVQLQFLQLNFVKSLQENVLKKGGKESQFMTTGVPSVLAGYTVYFFSDVPTQNIVQQNIL